MKIDCTVCEMYRSEHCDDCLVSAVLHSPTQPAVDIDEALAGPLQTLQGAGLIPVLKFRPRSDPDGEKPERAAG